MYKEACWNADGLMQGFRRKAASLGVAYWAGSTLPV
jgi:hypothetical protein